MTTELKEHKEVEADVREVYDLKDVPVFKAGKWKGQEYTRKDLQSMANAFNELKGQIKPYLKLGHDENQELVQKDGLPAAGWITNAKVIEDDFCVDLSSMPKKIKELVESKAYGRFSSEIYHNLMNNGKKYDKVLRAVALLGGDTPEVKSLDDFINLYEMDEEGLKKYTVEEDVKLLSTADSVQILQTEEDMDNKDTVTVDVANVDEVKDNIEKLTEDNKELSEKFSALEKELEEKKVKLSEMEIDSEKKDIVTFLEAKVQEGIVTPAQKHLYTSIAMANSIQPDDKGVRVYEYTENNETKKVEFSSLIDLVKQVVENNGKQVNLKEESKKAETSEKVDSTAVEDSDDLYDDIKKYMDDNKMEDTLDNYKTARNAVRENKYGGKE